MVKIFSIWCEWDVGQDGQHFSSKEKAIEWLKENIHIQELLYQFDSDLDYLFEGGLLNIEEENLD